MRVPPFKSPIFRQLLEFKSNTYTYILACHKTGEAAIIDPVVDTVSRDVQICRDLNLKLLYGINTHVHADHVTGTHKLKSAFPSMQSVLCSKSGGEADKYVSEGDVIKVGGLKLEVRETPGHTNGCVSYVEHFLKAVFTGDALLNRACGRTDFQQGNPSTLYDSVHNKIFSLPDDYLIYVGHNYDGIMQTTVWEEKTLNPRLTKSKEEFVLFMKDMKLQYPKQIDVAVPANMKDGKGHE
ncbi:hypothetical protein CRE_30598 [Caenorhabditis remanei]|uniref:Persulfide dioxygenase ETHE1, mitochondrial n=1 Tax=Caenorhabditis remanei TaxID=31234 RepID=E3NSC1_CAERE|nr:hypothetical protein CRE_30598 [Caenorhabditis remanei]